MIQWIRHVTAIAAAPSSLWLQPPADATRVQVYKASLEGGRVTVAVKVLNESFQTEVYLLKREMQLLARVQSPYVTEFIDSIFGPEMMLVMEFLEGGSLYESLAQGDPVTCKTNIFSWYKRYAHCLLRLLELYIKNQQPPVVPDIAA